MSYASEQHFRGKRRTQEPCTGCYLHQQRCICEFIPRLDLKTKVSLVVHYKELKRTTNTGRLAVNSLTNSEMIIRGQRDQPLEPAKLVHGDYRTLLFFPAEEAIELTSEFVRQSEQPIQLIVPDGNWRQASKIHHRHVEFDHLPRVMIKTPNLETRHLRAESTKEGMATLQAIAHALGVIEGEAVKQSLLELYRRKLHGTLRARGYKI